MLWVRFTSKYVHSLLLYPSPFFTLQIPVIYLLLVFFGGSCQFTSSIPLGLFQLYFLFIFWRLRSSSIPSFSCHFKAKCQFCYLHYEKSMNSSSITGSFQCHLLVLLFDLFSGTCSATKFSSTVWTVCRQLARNYNCFFVISEIFQKFVYSSKMEQLP